MKACLRNVFWWRKQWWKSSFYTFLNWMSSYFSDRQNQCDFGASHWFLQREEWYPQRPELKKAAVGRKLRIVLLLEAVLIAAELGPKCVSGFVWHFTATHSQLHCVSTCSDSSLPEWGETEVHLRASIPAEAALMLFGNTIKPKRIISGFLQETKLFTKCTKYQTLILFMKCTGQMSPGTVKAIIPLYWILIWSLILIWSYLIANSAFACHPVLRSEVSVSCRQHS